MTQEELEEQAEKHLKNLDDCRTKELMKDTFIDGAKWGMEHATQWHDLRKCPDDLPKYKNSMTIRICWINPYENKCYHNAYYDGKWFFWVSEKSCKKQYADHRVIAWCELPTYKE